MNQILYLPPNLVRRNYIGGKIIREIHGDKNATDNNMPEEWVGSLVGAKNPGQEEIVGEGLSFVEVDGKKVFLKDLIAENPEYYLGDIYKEGTEFNLGFLFKILDSMMRLHVQAHPTADFAKKYLNSDYGKLECYYILEVREGTDPYIRVGFQKDITKEEWKEIVEKQDIDKMDALFEKVPVKRGDVFYIPGGVPHAIGENITMLEIMEPTDLVVRCEYEREGVIVPPEARFMNKGIDFCMDIFDYNKYSVDDIIENFKVTPKTLIENDDVKIEKIVDNNISKSFSVDLVHLKNNSPYHKENIPQVGIVCFGRVKIETKDGEHIFNRGDSFFLPAGVSDYKLYNLDDEDSEICVVSSVKQ